MVEHSITVDDSAVVGDVLGAEAGAGPAEDFVQITSLTEGATLEHDVYAVHGSYVEVPDLDGKMVQIERPYEKTAFATGLQPSERGNLLASAGTVVTAELAAQVA